MQLTAKRSTGRSTGHISFPLLECWNPLAELALLVAEVDKQRVTCRVSLAVLKENFVVSAEDPMLAVAENRATLQAVARKLIERGAFENDGSILIRSKDF